MFDQSVIDAFTRHAASEWPKEACGIVVDGVYRPCDNIHDNPNDDFRIAEKRYVELTALGKVEAILHSHTSVEDEKGKVIEKPMPHPSALDLKSQRASGVPWGIGLCRATGCNPPFYFGDQLPIAPLVGRPFIHGVWDCYSLVRDWFRLEKGLTLIDMERDHYWWEKGQNIYEDNFKRAGFHEIDKSEVREGDCFIMRVHSEVPCHAGVYIGNGLLLHHVQHHLSARVGISPWAQRVDRWLRHESMDDKPEETGDAA